MENASKALIFAASIIIGVLLLTFMVYIFRKFDAASSSSEKRLSQREIDEINSKFVGYETGGSHTADDLFTITYARKKSGSDVQILSYKYRDLFKNTTSTSLTSIPTGNQEKYNKSLF